jgi:hypothetical protein
MNRNGIFTSSKYLAPVNGLSGAPGGCGCQKSASGLGLILNQEPVSLAVGVAVWCAGAVFLWHVFKNINSPAPARAAS